MSIKVCHAFCLYGSTLRRTCKWKGRGPRPVGAKILTTSLVRRTCSLPVLLPIKITQTFSHPSFCNSVHRQVEANDLLSTNLRTIPAHCFYTAMPQLISRIGHENKETAQVVRAILIRVLTKHPGQAMWSLAWLLHSADKERAYIGEEIFKGAQASLFKRKENKSQRLLAASKSLFRHLINIAK